jgi:hypothetical protein
MKQRLFLTFPLYLLLTACGPIYDTAYRFLPPEDSSGRVCIYQCENGRLQCRTIQEMQSRNCEAWSNQDVANCEANIRIYQNREPKWYECTGESCSPDYDQCDLSYRNCYEACGGRVISETRCVANCQSLAPSPVN